MTNLPTTPAECRAERERVLELYQAAEHKELSPGRDPSDLDSWSISAMQGVTNFAALSIPNHDRVLALGLFEGDAQLWAAAPALARAYADLLEQHAQVLEALEEERMVRDFAHRELRYLRRQLVECEEEQPRWISVEEALPEEGQAVLVYWQAPAGWLISCARHTSTEGVWMVEEIGYSPRTGNVTHWQPLPAPPAQAEKAQL